MVFSFLLALTSACKAPPFAGLVALGVPLCGLARAGGSRTGPVAAACSVLARSARSRERIRDAPSEGDATSPTPRVAARRACAPSMPRRRASASNAVAISSRTESCAALNSSSPKPFAFVASSTICWLASALMAYLLAFPPAFGRLAALGRAGREGKRTA